MKVGITGTRNRITFEQDDTIWKLIKYMGATEIHHGDCTGADAASHAAVLGIRHQTQEGYLPPIKLIIHPPIADVWRAFCQDYDEIREPLLYSIRNHAIVDETDLLIAVPQTSNEQIRSGTWATIRYARQTGKPVMIIEPNGGWRLDTVI